MLVGPLMPSRRKLKLLYRFYQQKVGEGKACNIHVIAIYDLFSYIGRNWRRMGDESLRMAHRRIGCRQGEVSGCVVGQNGLQRKTGVKSRRNLLLQGL